MMVPVAHAAVSADGAVKSRGGELHAVLLTAGAGAAATLILYDNPSAASGTILCSLAALTGTSASFTPSSAWPFSTGCYADISGAGAAATVLFI